MTESRIYTKLGDDGSTGLLFGGRISKADPLIDIVGTLDETVAALGMARANTSDQRLSQQILGIQRDLFVAAADLAANPYARDRLVPGVSSMTAAMTSAIECAIDERVAERPLQPVFIVPGATHASAALDVARTSVRRAERALVRYLSSSPEGTHPVSPSIMTYLNRVSDLLYVLARHAAGDHEEPVSHE